MRVPPELRDQAAIQRYLVARMAADQAMRSHPWYDSVWLARYVAAKTLIAQIRPAMLADFVAAFEPLRTRKDFKVVDVPKVFDDDTLAAIRRSIEALPQEAARTNEVEQFGRVLARNQPLHAELHKTLAPMVGELVGEPVEASYNFLSLYSEFGVCEPHMDAPNAKWTLDVCIDQTRTWPIHFSQVVDWPEESDAHLLTDWKAAIRSNPDLRFEARDLEPGRAVVFSGSSQWHHRDPMPEAAPGDHCHLLFFHFLPAGMGEIVRPVNWAAHFAMPELDWIVEATET